MKFLTNSICVIIHELSERCAGNGLTVNVCGGDLQPFASEHLKYGRRKGGQGDRITSGFWNFRITFLAKKVVLSVLRRKNETSPLFIPEKIILIPWKNPLEKPTIGHPGKNPSDAHDLERKISVTDQNWFWPASGELGFPTSCYRYVQQKEIPELSATRKTKASSLEVCFKIAWVFRS